jgi:hypothetical protein
MKNKEMQEHLIDILNEYSMRTDLVNKYIINPYTFVFLKDDELSENDRWEYYIRVCKELKIKNRIMRSPGIDSDGGRKMKIEGHLNEELVSSEILNSLEKTSFTNLLSQDEKVIEVICDGIKSKKVDSIVEGKKTTPKCDIKVVTSNRIIKLSIKKSNSGQVHLNKVKSFIAGYEQLYTPIPKLVKEALLFLFSGHDKTISILKDPKYYNENTNELETHHETLTIETMNKYNPSLSEELLIWIKDNIKNVAEIVFKRGWVLNEEYWGQFILYRNKLNNSDMDDIVDIDVLISKCSSDDIKFGTENGGTTIILPFGSVQYHLGGLQFHHNRKKILDLVR